MGLVMALLLVIAAAPARAEADWRLERESDGISVWTRSVEGSKHRAMRARMVVDTSIMELVALIRDTRACSEWAEFCAASHVHESMSEAEAYIYTRNDLPWPVADRDALSHVRWTADASSGAVRMDAVATTGRLAPQPGAVRLNEAVTSWSFTPTEAGVLVESEAHVDPAGPIPAWITNRLLVDAPLKTMGKLRDLAATGRYADIVVGFVPKASM